LISIWLTPVEEDGNHLQKLIQELAEEYEAPIFPPHCTLYSPSDLNSQDIEKILKNVAKCLRPLFVTLYRLNNSPLIWKTVFIELERSEELVNMQQKLIHMLPNAKHYEFLPHMSLIYKEMSDKMKKEIIQSITVQSSYKMDKIVAMHTGPDVANWRKVVEVQLNA